MPGGANASIDRSHGVRTILLRRDEPVQSPTHNPLLFRSVSAFSLHNDEPDINDLLERGPLVGEVARWVATCRPPMVVGIHGDWGSGKTSFLHQLQFALSGECPQNASAPMGQPRYKDAAVVWFEAWRYQYEDAPVVALLHEIRAQLTWKSHFFTRLTRDGKKMAEVALRSALLNMEEVTKMIGFQATHIEQAGEAWEKEHLSVSLPSHNIRDLLDNSIKELLGGGKKPRRLVVIIDDLDRCEAQTAFRLLEGIKIYLNLSSCVFVLGINRREIERAIAKFIPAGPKTEKDATESRGGERTDGDEVLVRAQEYLEKLCSTIWPLRLPSRQQQRQLAARWLDSATPRAVVEGICGLIERHGCLPANPRKIKALCNTVGLLLARRAKELEAVAGVVPAEDAAAILVVASISQFHPPLHRLLQADATFYEEIRRWARSSDASNQSRTHDVFRYLVRTHESFVDEKAPTQETDFSRATNLYVDPAYGNVLRIQTLIAEHLLTVADLEPYLAM